MSTERQWILGRLLNRVKAAFRRSEPPPKPQQRIEIVPAPLPQLEQEKRGKVYRWRAPWGQRLFNQLIENSFDEPQQTPPGYFWKRDLASSRYRLYRKHP